MQYGINEGCDSEILSMQNLNFTASLSYGKATGIYWMPPAYDQLYRENGSSFKFHHLIQPTGSTGL